MERLMENIVLAEDMEYIFKSLSEKEKDKLKNSKVLITGCAGFLGYYLMNFFVAYSKELGIKKIIGLDNFLIRKPTWIMYLQENKNVLRIYEFDVVTDTVLNLEGAKNADFVIHMASVASPTFYRKYPIETLDANIWGLRKLLDIYKEQDVKGFLFFSSSEIYGDPLEQFIPTDEEYRGNVSPIGPRACYDESKRIGETMCYLFSERYELPITIVRPFNNYGPGMSLDDKRVPSDFAKAVFENRDIEIYSDGSPTRTFCYVSDAIIGYLKALLYGRFDYFNIGIDKPEISIRDLASIYIKKGQEIFNYTGISKFTLSPEKEYLTHNPNRRCPSIDKAKRLLNYNPSIYVEDGVKRFLEFIKTTKGML
jgi:UDP-glucuronate decarboxylase